MSVNESFRRLSAVVIIAGSLLVAGCQTAPEEAATSIPPRVAEPEAGAGIDMRMRCSCAWYIWTVIKNSIFDHAVRIVAIGAFDVTVVEQCCGLRKIGIGNVVHFRGNFYRYMGVA